MNGFGGSGKQTGSQKNCFPVKKWRKKNNQGLVHVLIHLNFLTLMFLSQREHRDLGLIIMSDRVHFHMSGLDSDGPLYQLDPGYSGAISDLDTWVQDEINTGLGKLLRCQN